MRRRLTDRLRPGIARGGARTREEGTTRRTDVIVIGAGQAALAMSQVLTARWLDHVVLERNRIAEHWRSERWNSLRLLTPNWCSRLPGWCYHGPDPDGFMTMPEVVRYFDRFVTEWRYDRFGFLVTRSIYYLGCLIQANALVGDFAAAARYAEEATSLAEETRRPLDAYAVQYHRNLFESIRGPTEAELDRMREVAEDSLERAPYPFSPWLLSSWGYARMRAGQHADAEQTFERALQAAKAVNMLHFANLSRGILAWVRALGGDERAPEELEWASRRAEKDGDCWLRIRVLGALAGLDADPAEAVARLREAAAIDETCGFRPLHARILARIGQRLADTDPAGARDALEHAARIFEEIGLTAEAAEARSRPLPASA